MTILLISASYQSSQAVGLRAFTIRDGSINYGWVLTGARGLKEPIPCKGALGLWEVPPRIVQQIQRQLPHLKLARRDRIVAAQGAQPSEHGSHHVLESGRTADIRRTVRREAIGRGTRLFDGKDYFTIYDFVRAYEHFNDPEWDGELTDPVVRKPKPGEEDRDRPLPEGHTVNDAAALLGSVSVIRDTFVDFQQYLYQAPN